MVAAEAPVEVAPSMEDACDRWGDRVAVVSGDEALTFAGLEEQVRTLASAYRRLGIGPGDRIVCAMGDVPAHVVAVHAAWACGAIHVGAHPDLTGAELSALVGRLQAAALLFQPRQGRQDPLEPFTAVARTCPATRRIVSRAEAGPGDISLEDLLAGPPAPGPVAPPGTAATAGTAVLFLTSGTTGQPKAVCDTLPALSAKLRFFADFYRPGPDDVHLMYLPLCHAFGMKLTLLALRSGGRLVLLDRFSPKAALELVASQRVTVLPGTPTHLTLMLDALDQHPQAFDSVRWAVTAAAALPPSVSEQIYARLGADLLVVYGCSEGFLTATTDRDEILAGSVGRTVFASPHDSPAGGAVRILSLTDGTPLGAGAAGEIAFSAVTPVRYWDAPDAGTDGWYRSGDLGRIDADGSLYVLGRLKELVNRGGLKVAPNEIEAALTRHPTVADAAVLGTPDPVLGEAICACVVPAAGDGLDLAQVRTFLGTTLARHKLPDELCLLSAIPRSSLGKLDRRTLHALVVDGDAPRQRLRRR